MRKKMLSLFLAGALGISMLFAGCGQEAPGSDSKEPKSTQAPEATGQAEGQDTAEDAADTELYVFLAASLNNAMEEIGRMFNKNHPEVAVRFNADSSGTLQTQIEEGAQCDIFFSAAQKQMEALQTGGYVEGEPVNLLENKVVLIKPKGGQTEVTGFEDITKAANIALAGEDVPVGQYAREIFTNLGIMEQVNQMEINQGKNVTEVLAAVSEASNEVGVVYATDANSVKDSVEIMAEAPEGSLNTPVLYPVGLIKDEQADETENQAAEDFLAYLQTPEVIAIFENYGFTAYQK